MEKSAEELLDTEWWRVDPAEFITDLHEIETLVRRLSAQSLRAITVAESRGIAPSAGYLSLGLLLRDALRITAADAQRRMVHAEALDRHPVLAQAASDGALGTDHIAVITSTLADLPDNLPPEEADRAEHRIVATAKLLDSRTLRAHGRRLVYDYDQDGREPVDEPLRHSDNELNYHVGRSGKVSFRGMLEPEVGAAFTALLSPLAKPRPSEDQPDLRSAEERRGDAFAEIVVLAANAAKAPVEGGERPHITVTMPLDALRDGIGTVSLGDSESLSAAQARRLACDAAIIPAVLGSRSETLDIGRTKRVIPSGIRHALVLRDGGCTFPHCDRPQAWTDAHHIRHWADGGPTTVENLVLLCRLHHRLTHTSPWRVRIRDGLPEFIPPAYLDPLQKPRHNILHWQRHPLPA